MHIHVQKQNQQQTRGTAALWLPPETPTLTLNQVLTLTLASEVEQRSNPITKWSKT